MLRVPNPTLQDVYDKQGITLASGEFLASNTLGPIGWDFANALYETARKYKPAHALEIGFASGVSALSILTALAENGPDGRLTSIDPFQDGFRGTGRLNVERAGFAGRHRLLGDMDYLALPRLVADGEQFGLVYIDGSHAFNHVILDAFYADLLLGVGGIMAFNDCGWLDVHAALKHVPDRGRYAEVDVGLGKDYRGRNPLVSAQRWVTGRSSADRYFRKTA